MRVLCCALIGLLLWTASGCDEAPATRDESVVLVQSVQFTTTLGQFTLALNAEAAPLTVANFSRYVNEGHYDGRDGLPKTTFHRVIAGFMVQGGGMRTDGKKKLVYHDPVAHEGPNGLLNVRGSVAMARTSDPDSATSQFFVNHVDNTALDYVSDAEPGYVVFGVVTSGMETIDAIAESDTDGDDVPLVPVIIESVEVLVP
ncbi:MAG: peptidylprolyl isomerase [Myxococcota bacterium]